MLDPLDDMHRGHRGQFQEPAVGRKLGSQMGDDGATAWHTERQQQHPLASVFIACMSNQISAEGAIQWGITALTNHFSLAVVNLIAM